MESRGILLVLTWCFVLIVTGKQRFTSVFRWTLGCVRAVSIAASHFASIQHLLFFQFFFWSIFPTLDRDFQTTRLVLSQVFASRKIDRISGKRCRCCPPSILLAWCRINDYQVARAISFTGRFFIVNTGLNIAGSLPTLTDAPLCLRDSVGSVGHSGKCIWLDTVNNIHLTGKAGHAENCPDSWRIARPYKIILQDIIYKIILIVLVI